MRKNDPKLLTVDEVLGLPVVQADVRLSYGRDDHQVGDLYLPSGAGPHPLVVLLHGGCWRARVDRSYLGGFAQNLTEDGLAVWNLEYRRVGGGGGWPETFQDVAAGTDFLPEIAAEHRLDLSRCVAVGHSAGGHLGLWLAGRRRLPATSALYRPNPLKLKGVISLAGIPDLAEALAQEICQDMVKQLLGGRPDEMPGRFRDGAPAALLPLGVPQILINGTHDHVVPAAYIERYARAAALAGDDVRLEILPDTGHFEIVVPGTTVWPMVRSAILELV